MPIPDAADATDAIPLMPPLMPPGTAHRGDATQAAATAGVPECWQQAEQASLVFAAR